MKQVTLNFYLNRKIEPDIEEGRIARVKIAVDEDGTAAVVEVISHVDTHKAGRLSQSESHFYSPEGENWSVHKTSYYCEPYCDPVNETEIQREHPFDHLPLTWDFVVPSEPVILKSGWGHEPSRDEDNYLQWRMDVTLRLLDSVGVTSGSAWHESYEWDDEEAEWKIERTESTRFELHGNEYVYRRENVQYKWGPEPMHEDKEGVIKGCPVCRLCGFDWQNFKAEFPEK